MLAMLAVTAGAARAEEWAASIEVRQEENLCLTYQARLEGAFLVVRAAVEPGWHTFAMDNKVRAEEKLAGKQSLGIDRPTEIVLTGGLQVAGPWYQSAPTDFSRPELRWFSWGFAQEARFAARVRRTSVAPARIAFRGQACTETVCKNIDVALSLPRSKINTSTDSSGVDLKNLVQVR
jgi:hypothetical protein